MMPRFRAWDKELKQMVYDVQDTYDGLEYSKANKDIDLDVYDWMDCFESWFNDRRFDLMQDTGLKDKNGIEIYEGCIIMDEDFRKYAVVFADGMFGCMKSHLADYVTKRRYEVIDPLYNMTLNSVCIIGNIYENPELLEENQNEH